MSDETTAPKKDKAFKFWLGRQVLKLYLRVLWWGSRKTIIGMQHIEPFLLAKKPIIACFWHQHMLAPSMLIIRLHQQRRLKLTFLISPSKDGEIPTGAMRDWGIPTVRGSSSKTGASALRQMTNIIKREGRSLCITPDGPRGPVHEFKSGALIVSRFTGAPVIPLSVHADKCWKFNSWDGFILPKPFTRFVLTIGEPLIIDAKATETEIETHAQNMQKYMYELYLKARDKAS
ncbi:MAG: lysophospholipid acyltransferase family protein [Gammaproteobacteria bacterium]|nr:lysophospholipid acyltransferase family protein [Gammaproteobacteria bacterium]